MGLKETQRASVVVLSLRFAKYDAKSLDTSEGSTRGRVSSVRMSGRVLGLPCSFRILSQTTVKGVLVVRVDTKECQLVHWASLQMRRNRACAFLNAIQRGIEPLCFLYTERTRAFFRRASEHSDAHQ